MNGLALRRECVLNLLAGLLVTHFGIHAARATPQAADPVAAPINIIGQVTDDAGTPVPNAAVFAVFAREAHGYEAVTQQTGSDGRYELEVPSDLSGDVSVVGWKKGLAIGLNQKEIGAFFTPGDRVAPGSAIDLPIKLAPHEPLALTILDSAGEPVTGGTVSVSAFSFPDGSATFFLNRTLLDVLTREIDTNGQITIDYLPAGLGAGLLVETKSHGVQNILVGLGRVAADAVVQLLPAATVNLTLASDDPDQVRNRMVAIETRPPRQDNGVADRPSKTVTPFRAISVVTTNDAGTATAIVAAGTLSVDVSIASGARVFPENVTPLQLAAGESRDVTINFKPGLRVHGHVLTDNSDPVKGVKLTFAKAPVVTAADGSFESWVPATGQIYGRVLDVPDGFVWPYEESLYATLTPDEGVPENKPPADYEFPPITVKVAESISGTVVDASGRPVANADVRAAWVQEHDVQSYFTLKTDAARTDAQGRFRLQHVLSDADVRVTAMTAELAIPEARMIHSDGPQEVELEVSADGMITIGGVARGSDGRLIENPEIRITHAFLAPHGQSYGTRPVEFAGNRSFVGAADGTFRTPTGLPRFEKYSVTISAPGYLGLETEFQSPPKTGDTFDIGEVVLTRARSVSGRVVNSSGEPIAGATVWSWAAPADGGRNSGNNQVRTKTDAAGNFELPQLHPKTALAFAEMDGYRLTGTPLMLDAADVTITAFRKDEVLPPEHSVRPVLPNDNLRFAAARKLLEKVLPQQRASSYFHGEAIDMLVRMDPDAALSEVEQSASAGTRSRALAGLGAIEDALAEAETITDGQTRAYARFRIVDASTDAEQSREILATILLDAQSIRTPDRRLMVLATVAGRFAELGDHEQAERILRSELSQAQALSSGDWAGYARASFAERLSLYDTDAAIKMVSEAAEDDQTRHFQNMAHLLAGIRPEAAEAVIDRIHNHRYVDSPVVRVVYRMAPVDFPRALKLVDGIDQQRRRIETPRALGAIAMAIRDQQPEEAKRLLARAYDAIRGRYTGSQWDDVLGVSMTLLQYAEKIDPENLTDYYWRTLSNYAGPTSGAWSPDSAEEENVKRQAELALVVALYDGTPGLARQILEPAFAYWDAQTGQDGTRFTDHEGVLMAMALTDPDRTVDWALRFNEKLTADRRRLIPQPWEVIGNTLTKSREAIGKQITREVFHRWVIDEYDF